MIILTMLGTNFIFATGLEAYNLTLNLSHASIKKHQNLTISGTVEKNGEGFGRTPVTVRIINEKHALIFVEQLTTDNNGVYQVVFLPPDDLTPGNYQVVINGAGVNKDSSFALLATDPGAEVPEQPGSPGGGSSNKKATPTPPTPPEKNENSVGTEGGTLALITGKLWLQIPPGALTETAVMTAIQLTPAVQQQAREAGKGQGYELVSDVYNLTMTPNLSLKKPVALSFDLGEAALKGKDHRLLGIYQYIANVNQWIYIGGKLDADGKMTVEVTDFGTYGVLYYEKVYEDMINHWARDEVKVTTAKHITQGMTPTHYQPDGNVTRAQFAALLVRALKLPTAAYGGMFKDADPSQWYTIEVEAAARAGIVEGHDGLFNPDASITREAMATMLVRALKYAEGYTSPPITMDGSNGVKQLFKDQGEIAPWAASHVNDALGRGLMQGMDPTTFAPRQSATRAQAAVTIYRLLTKLNQI